MKEWLDNVIDPDLRWKNCYRATQHGWNASEFHKRCDKKGPTLTLVQVGKSVFGGYTDLDWGGKNIFFDIRTPFQYFLLDARTYLKENTIHELNSSYYRCQRFDM